MKSIFIDSTADGSWCGGGDAAHNQIDTSTLAVFKTTMADVEQETFHDILITSISEAFSEGESRHGVITDSFISLATGANPIKINLSGYLIRAQSQDNRSDFLKVYKSSFRGTAAQRNLHHLEFLLKGSCSFKFSLHDLSVVESTTLQDLTQVVLTGIAYDYVVIPPVEIEDGSSAVLAGDPPIELSEGVA